MTETEEFVLIRKEDPESVDSQVLLDEVDASSALFYGGAGRSSVFHEEVRSPRSTFLVVRTPKGFAVGCAALLRLDYGVGELKYLYSRALGGGIGDALLSRVEADAAALGYGRLALQSHISNRRTISFCNRNGFRASHRFSGIGCTTERAWFEKALTSPSQARRCD